MSNNEPQLNDADSHAAADPEFADALSELRPSVSQLREAIDRDVRPTDEGRAHLRRAMVSWVEDDVTTAFQSAGLRSQVASRLRNLGSTWRELIGQSRSFRWATQGAFALGAGLLLGFVVDYSATESVRADSATSERVLVPSEDAIRRLHLKTVEDAVPGRLEKEGPEVVPKSGR